VITCRVAQLFFNPQQLIGIWQFDLSVGQRFPVLIWPAFVPTAMIGDERVFRLTRFDAKLRRPSTRLLQLDALQRFP
jgi:hypothetical protein